MRFKQTPTRETGTRRAGLAGWMHALLVLALLGVGAASAFAQPQEAAGAPHLGGEANLGRPRDRGHLSYLDGRRLRLERGRLQQRENYESRLRGTSPPAAATSSISLQRLAQGLNLLALCPSAQVCIASSRWPANQRARPSSK